MRVLVCGGRNYLDANFLFATLDRMHASRRITEVITGGASGADTLAIEWAKARDIPFQIFFAAWHEHGRGAGPIRNRQMLEEGWPDLVIAFPGGHGTAGMVKLAQKAGVPVEIVASIQKSEPEVEF
jgi:hypothetical protein